MADTFIVMATAIVNKDGKFLIGKRSDKEKLFPSLWTVPGGKLHIHDYAFGPRDTEHYWYNALEKALGREVMEEANIKIQNIRYVTSLADKPENRAPGIVISMLADYVSGEPEKNEELVEFAWVNAKEVEKYELIEGIQEEIEQAEKLLAGERTVWVKKSKVKSIKSKV